MCFFFFFFFLFLFFYLFFFEKQEKYQCFSIGKKKEPYLELCHSIVNSLPLFYTAYSETSGLYGDQGHVEDCARCNHSYQQVSRAK